MRRPDIEITRFGNLVTELSGEGNPSDATDMLNLTQQGLSLVPRNSYANVRATPAAPGQTFASLGLGYALDPAGGGEFISVEDRNGTIHAYSIHRDTFVDTQIGTDELAAGDWLITYFFENSYLINPGGTKSVWRHVTSDSTSLVPLQDSAYSPIASPELSLDRQRPASLYQWPSTGDTFTYVGTLNSFTIAPPPTFDFATEPGSIILSGPSEDHGGDGGGTFAIKDVFGTAQDWSGVGEYLYINFAAGPYLLRFLETTTKPQLKIGGVFVNVTDAQFQISEDLQFATWEIYTGGMTVTAIQGIAYEVNCKPGRGATSAAEMVFLTIKPIYSGGVYINSEDAAHRIWGIPLDDGDVTFGAVYSDGAGTDSAIFQKTISSDQAHGFTPSSSFPDASYASPIGAKINLSVAAPDGVTYDRVYFLRLDTSVSPAKWKYISTVTTGPFTYTEIHHEYDVAGLVDYLAGTAPDPPPVFRTEGINFAFPWNQSMVWLVDTGESNVQISRVGNAEELYSSAANYGPTDPNDPLFDKTIPAQRTLADNQADRPVWGVQAGPHIFMAGEHAAYAMDGSFPRTLGPSQQVPGSRGIAGPLAGCRVRPSSGEYCAAYADRDLNIWLLTSVPQFVGDTRARPIELSIENRLLMKKFLLLDQLAEFPSLTVSKTILTFQESSTSLWVILGRRAMVLRHSLNGSGWEPYKYQLTTPPGTSESSSCTLYSPGVNTPTNVVRTDWNVDWVSPAYGAVEDGNEASSGPMTVAGKTKLLRSGGILPVIPVPVGATLDSVKFRFKHRKTGDFVITHDWLKMVVSGSPTGSNLSTADIVDVAGDTVEVVITTGLPSIADCNASNVGFELGYTSEPGNGDWYDPTKYTIGVVMSVPAGDLGSNTQSATGTINVTYTGSLPKPTSIDLDITTLATCGFDVTLSPVFGGPAIYQGTADVTDDGLGNTSGIILVYDPPTNGNKASAGGSELLTLALVAGVGSTVLTASGVTVPGSGAGMGIKMTYLVTAGLHARSVSSVFVDSMEISYCSTVSYSIGSQTSGISIEKAVFTPDGRYIWMRNTGQVDLIEYDFRNDSFIGPPGSINRDGGYPMPDWLWVSNRYTFEGAEACLRSVQVNTLDPGDTVNVESKVMKNAFIAGDGEGSAASRWWKFPVDNIGLAHQVRISGSENVFGLDGLKIELRIMSRGKAK